MKLKLHRPIFYYLLVAARWFFSLLPYRLGFSFGGTLGKLSYLVLAGERRRTLDHLRGAFGDEKSDSQIRAIGQAVFEHYGKLMAEWLLIDKITARLDEFVTAEGYEHFDKALAAGKGAVVVIAHFGNWEIMGGYTALKGYPCTVIAREIYLERYDRYLVALRRKMGVKTIYRNESPRAMLTVLKNNGMLGFVVDQDLESVSGVFVNFFARPAFTSTAPVRFAVTSEAPVIPVFIIREGIRHRMVVEPAIPMRCTEDKEDDLKINTQRWVEVQEKYIRRYPHLWVWNHRRWKTALKPEEASLVSR